MKGNQRGGEEGQVGRSLVGWDDVAKERETGSGTRSGGENGSERRRQGACKYVTKEYLVILTVLEQLCHYEGPKIHVAGLSWMCVNGWCRNLRPAKCLNLCLPSDTAGLRHSVFYEQYKVDRGFIFSLYTTKKEKTSRLAAALRVTSRRDTSWEAGCRMYGRSSLLRSHLVGLLSRALPALVLMLYIPHFFHISWDFYNCE